MPRHTLTRRGALQAMAATAGAALTTPAGAQNPAEPPLSGRLKQSVCKWCYKDLSLEELCRAAVDIGLKGVDLLGEEEWAVVQGFGLTCPMANGPGGINSGWNDPALHDELVAKSEILLPKVAQAGLPNMIVFSGNRRGMADAEGLKNCAVGLKRILPLAETLGVTICMELLNSKRDHKDYMCDHTAWGVELVQRLGSPRFKLLYDIYHMQIMEGDVIQTIVDNIEHIAHFHTGGVPGRNEIDETQELNYRRICEAIVETGFDGYLAQEFVPARDPLTSLRQAAVICDV
jgi:hydroxypyruvate isomerase